MRNADASMIDDLDNGCVKVPLEAAINDFENINNNDINIDTSN